MITFSNVTYYKMHCDLHAFFVKDPQSYDKCPHETFEESAFKSTSI